MIVYDIPNMASPREVEPPSALSPALQNIIFVAGMHTDIRGSSSTEILESNAAINVQLCNGFFEFGEQDGANLGSSLGTSDTDPSYYECCVKQLSPLFKQSESLLSQMDEGEFKQRYFSNFLWTSNPELFLEVHSLLLQNNSSQDMLALLILCCGLERSLGNLFLVKGTQCPTMLKELLVTPELCEILGLIPLQVLQTVMGPPISMNIRNIAWHGFLAEGELPRRYIFFLLLLSASLGKFLKDRGHDPAAIPIRDYVSLTRIEKIASRFTELSKEDYYCAECAVSSSWVVDKSNRTLFETAVDLMKNGRYGKSSVILIPLLEHALRKLFVKVNNCPSRLITAETTSLFTTFEEILEPNLPSGDENKLPGYLGEPFMDLLHDILVYPAGPRCRDKLSHGEVDFQAVDVSLPRILLVLLAWLNIDKYEEQELIQKLTKCIGRYSSLFHPVALLQEKIVDLAYGSQNLAAEITMSPDLKPWNEGDGLEAFAKDNRTLMETKASLVMFASNVSLKIPHISESQWECLRDSLSFPLSKIGDQVRMLLCLMKIKTLYRWKTIHQQDKPPSSASAVATKNQPVPCSQSKGQRPSSSSGISESEVVGLVTRVATEASTALSQTCSALALRYSQLEAKQLRSRQRDNFRRLLFFAPCAGLLASYVVCLGIWVFSNLDSYGHLNSSQRIALQKHLRSALQAMENIRSYTSPDKNKWTEAGDLLLSEVNAACDRVEKGSYFKDLSKQSTNS